MASLSRFLNFRRIYFYEKGGTDGITNLIRAQREWGRKIYEVTDRRVAELRPLGYSEMQIAWKVAEEMKGKGYVPRKDVYTLFTISLMREFRKTLRRDGLDTWVRFFLDS